MNESYEEKIKRLRPIDDDFFKIYIHPIEIVKVIVEAILHKDVIISHCQSEAVMKNISGRTVEFDLYAKTEDDIYINLEIEKNKDRAIPKRANLHMDHLHRLLPIQDSYMITFRRDMLSLLQKRAY